MTNSAQYILQHLFGEGRLEDVSVDQLKQLVNEYPSFNAAHYLLSIKLQKDKDQDYLSETQRTALYFNNPLWLQWLLQSTEEKPIAHLEEIAAAMRMSDPSYQAEPVEETPAFIKEEITEEYFVEIRQEEPLQEAVHENSANAENYHEEFAAENPVLERYAEPAKEEYHPVEIKNEEPIQELETQTNSEEPFRVTFITEETVFEEKAEPTKEEYHHTEIKNEEPVQELNTQGHSEEQFHETF
ncbi:MAG: hypothetical protein JST75_17285, partial [Bacteroidetes bacterium]|nr:hypothetical protein [Bacteroidota bacterium]